MTGLGWRVTASGWRSTGSWLALSRSRRTAGCSRAGSRSTCVSVIALVRPRTSTWTGVSMMTSCSTHSSMPPITTRATSSSSGSSVPQPRLTGSEAAGFRVSASLAGRPFETFPLDAAFRADPAAADMLATADLLAFAGLAPVRVPALPLEKQVAEKLHAYTRSYEGGRPSSRTEDLVDIVLIAGLAALEAAPLAAAIVTTFTTGGTHPVPEVMPRPSADWSAPFSELAATVGIATDLAAAHAVAANLLTPILDGSAHDGGVWNIESQRWVSR